MGAYMKRAVMLSFLAIFLVILYVLFVKSCNTEPGKISQTPDTERVHDVLLSSWLVINYASENSKLPPTLELAAKYFHVRNGMIIDPSTKDVYDYVIIDHDTFKICAVFDAASRDNKRPIGKVFMGDPVTGLSGYWIHKKGKQCIIKNVPDRIMRWRIDNN